MPPTTEAPVAPTATSPPPPPPAPTSELHVTEGTVTDRGPAPAPPKPGSARDRLFQDLRKKAGVESETPPKPAVTTKPTPETKTETPETTTATDAETTTEAPPPTGTVAPEVDKKKVSPWKLVDQYKSRVAELEKAVADAKTTGLAETEKKTLTERLTQAETRLKEYEEELRYTNYQKHPEFKEKYQQPYEDAWKKWMGELGELMVPTADGAERPLAPQDLLELVNMPLQKAREQANQVFGDFADDVMSARKEIRSLFDAQNKALEEARKAGAERDQKRTEGLKAQQEAIRKQAVDLWNQVNEEVVKNEQYGHYFRPVEGDAEGNERLKKGFELADKAFSVNSFDPRLTPEQRAEIVKLHAAVRNRCASFGRLTYQNQKLQGELKALKEELAKFKGAQPGAGEGTRTEESQGHPSSAREAVFAGLRKYAHPA